MENMSVQHSELESIPTEVTIKEHKKFAIVAVSSGEGITNAFKELGADEIVSGGQTMNPSSEDFIEAFKRLDAENIIVFPNNKNIIMAAKQAAEAYEDANVVVMNTKSLAECYSALTMLDYSSDNLDEITDNFQMVIDNVVDGSITYAIRDSQIDEINIKKDDYMSFINGKIVASNSSKIEAVKALFNNVEDIEDKEVITLIYGKDVTDEEKNQVIQFLSTSFPSIEVGGIDGLQDIYSFIISIE
jgi:dihydroxyacetone kinase-like predicted kinase